MVRAGQLELLVLLVAGSFVVIGTPNETSSSRQKQLRAPEPLGNVVPIRKAANPAGMQAN